MEQKAFRIITLGTFSVGKTSLIMKLTDKNFQTKEKYMCTIGVDHKAISYSYKGKYFNLRFWDTAGQERFWQINKLYYRDTDAVILVYDISREESFQRLEMIYQQFLEANQEQVTFILVGNKSDMNREVSVDKAKEFARVRKIPWIQCSTKSGQNVEKILEVLVEELMEIRREDKSRTYSWLQKGLKPRKKRCC